MVKEKLINKEPVLGTMISEIGWPNLIRMLQVGGMEYVIIDNEHGPFDLSQLAGMIAIGNGIGMTVLVRVPSIDRGYITKVLDMGADGFLVPMVNTREEAELLVSYAKYAPIGKRGISTNRAHTGYNPPPLKEYMEKANKRTILLVQIETAQAVANAEEIASVPGLDALIVGPSDLSSDLGDPGNLASPALREAVVKAVEAAKKHGISSGTVSSNADYLHFCREAGMNLFCMSSELGMVVSGAKNVRKKFEGEVLGGLS